MRSLLVILPASLAFLCLVSAQDAVGGFQQPMPMMSAVGAPLAQPIAADADFAPLGARLDVIAPLGARVDGIAPFGAVAGDAPQTSTTSETQTMFFTIKKSRRRKKKMLKRRKLGSTPSLQINQKNDQSRSVDALRVLNPEEREDVDSGASQKFDNPKDRLIFDKKEVAKTNTDKIKI
ncbi:uncharacterized protein LOC132202546 [Neocloeon triangulifer]|uniref:uncharacterized protein LOC132202546 n=1 Tax=Neocloeon triangulifer TaxID=2078957 RepID=UPI00286EDF9E|nr:uncharacterized protein LOC132202546 [Neocloeon triangulifer]